MHCGSFHRSEQDHLHQGKDGAGGQFVSVYYAWIVDLQFFNVDERLDVLNPLSLCFPQLFGGKRARLATISFDKGIDEP